MLPVMHVAFFPFHSPAKADGTAAADAVALNLRVALRLAGFAGTV
jgi:hypothetical protein